MSHPAPPLRPHPQRTHGLLAGASLALLASSSLAAAQFDPPDQNAKPDGVVVFSFHHRHQDHVLGALNVMRGTDFITDGSYTKEDFYSMVDNGTEPKSDAKSSKTGNPIVEKNVPNRFQAIVVRISLTNLESNGSSDKEYFVSQPESNRERVNVRLFNSEGKVKKILHHPGCPLHRNLSPLNT